MYAIDYIKACGLSEVEIAKILLTYQSGNMIPVDFIIQCMRNTENLEEKELLGSIVSDWQVERKAHDEGYFYETKVK